MHRPVFTPFVLVVASGANDASIFMYYVRSGLCTQRLAIVAYVSIIGGHSWPVMHFIHDAHRCARHCLRIEY